MSLYKRRKIGEYFHYEPTVFKKGTKEIPVLNIKGKSSGSYSFVRPIPKKKRR